MWTNDVQHRALVDLMGDGSVERRMADLARHVTELEAENKRLRGLLGLEREDRVSRVKAWEPTLFPSQAVHPASMVTQRSSPEEKVQLFRSLFDGRRDVYALRWENAGRGKSGWAPAVKGGWANTRRPDRELLSFTHDVAQDHLAGKVHAGLYPLLRDDTCRLLRCQLAPNST